MDLAALVADASYITSLLGVAVQAAQDIAPFYTLLKQVLIDKTALTDDQRTALGVQEDAMRAMLDAPSIAADQP